MNRQAHLIIGAAFFLAYWYVAWQAHAATAGPGAFLAGIVSVSAGSLVPDILEPATSARHRGIFHSRRALKITGLLFLLSAAAILIFPGGPRSLPVFAASCFFLGWAAHLLADSLTRAGLPG